MPDVNTDIRVFPAKEMMAADMAYAIDAATLGSGILHGCEVSINNGALTIADGRILIKGRLAFITGGTIPLPTVTSGTYYLLAVCDLLAPSPFYIRLFSEQEKGDLDTQVSFTDETEFNYNNGTRYITLGTAVVDVALGVVTSYTASNDATPQDNSTRLSALESRIDRTLGDHQSHLSWLDNRRWSANKLVRDTIKYTSMPIPANSRARATVNIAYGSRYTATASGGTVSIHNTPGTDTGSVPSTPDAYGRNTSVNQNHKVLAITGITFSNAAVGGGANANKCVLAGFNRTAAATSPQVHNAYIDVYNLASSAAVIDIDVHVLYALYD